MRIRSLITSLIIISLNNIFYPQSAFAVDDLQSSCVIGSSTAGCEAYSPQEIYSLYGTTTDGTYYLSVGGTSVANYVLMSRNNSDNGGWILLMKGSKTSSNFDYSSSYFSSNSTTLNTNSLSNDVSTDAKFAAYNSLSVTKLLAIFKDPTVGSISTAGTGDLQGNPFAGHSWMETITAATAFSTLTNASTKATGAYTSVRYSIYRETSASNSTQVFSYQNGNGAYGLNLAPCASAIDIRWGVSWNQESDFASCDAYIGIGVEGYGSGDFVAWSGVTTGSVTSNTGHGKTGFQIWGKVADPSLLSPRSLTVTQSGSGTASLTWLAPASGTTSEYLIQYKTSAGNWSTATTHRLTNPSATPSASISGLSGGTYDFRVFARNSASLQTSATPVSASNISVDATSPTYSSSAVASSGTSLSLTYSETLSATTSAAARFTISRSFTGLGTETITISSVAASAAVVTLTLSSTIYVGDTITVSYSDPTAGDDANAIQDSAGNDAISITNQSVTNNSTQKRSQATLTLSSASLAYGSTLRLAATGGSGSGGITYAVTSGSCSITNTDSLTASSTGSCLVTATKAADSNYLVTTSSSATITVSASGSSATITVAVGNLYYRSTKSISAVASVAGRLTFRANNTIIAGCKNLAANAGNSYTRSCSYRPSSRGYVTIAVTLVPTDTSYTSSIVSSDRYFVYQRSGSR